MKELSYTITDPEGIHARPAGVLVKEAKNFKSEIVVKVNGKSAQATKLMALMSLGVKNGQTITVEVTGEDEDTACEAMKAFFEANL